MRFSLKWMLAAVAFVGFGCVALYNANEAWAMATVSFTVIVLLASILGAIHSISRAFYTGMAVFGWGYLILTYIPPMLESVKPVAATDALLAIAYKPMQRDVQFDPIAVAGEMRVFERYLRMFGVDVSQKYEALPNGTRVYARGQSTYVYEMPALKPYRVVGHSLFALIFAFIGGAVAQWVARRSKCDSA